MLILPQTIAQGDGDLSAALDNRAATHAKLGDLQAALRDGRLMIQEEKTGCLVRLSNSTRQIGR